MVNLSASMSLSEMEQELSRQLKSAKNKIRIFGDLDISQEDYHHLLLKIREAEQAGSECFEIMKEYRLCVLASWIFSLRLEKSEYSVSKRIQKTLVDKDQESVHAYIRMILETFEEYGLNTYHLKEDGTLQDLLELFVVHTGIPTELQDDFYHLLDDSLVYGEFSPIANRFLMRMPQHMQNLYKLVKKEVVVGMIDDCRKMFADYRLYGITQREAYTKYPIMSSDIMEGCFQWCEAQEVYAKELAL